MSHFGVVAPAFYSHFQVCQALGGELLDRGHHVTFFQQADARHWLTDPRIGFCALGAASHPQGSLAASLRRSACSTSPLGLRRVIRDLCANTAMLCAELPPALEHVGIDFLICDQMEAAGGLVASGLALPFVSIACALPVNRELHLPLAVMPFAYGTDERSRRFYEGSRKVYDWLMRPLRDVLHQASRHLALAPRDGLQDCLSPFAQISQTFDAFDLPREHKPDHFHAVGPLRAARSDAQGEWPVVPNQPFIFASLGTLQGGRLSMFKQMAVACSQLHAQLLIAHCGGLTSDQERLLIQAGATWITDFAPQQWAMNHADAVITHGGLNTVLDAIAARTPSLVMPIGFDQPGVAARVSYSGAGLQLSRHARASTISQRLKQLLDHPPASLRHLSADLASAGGVSRAADIVEMVIATREPVLFKVVS